jgi:hypothetical protein
MPRHDSLRELLDTLEISSLPDAMAAVEPRQGGRRLRRRERKQLRLLLVSIHRETLASLAAAIGEDSLPAAGRHARTKAVCPDTAEVMGLVGALHDFFLGGPSREASISFIVKTPFFPPESASGGPAT